MSRASSSRALVKSALSELRQARPGIVAPASACPSASLATRNVASPRLQRRGFFSLPDITKMANLVPGSGSGQDDGQSGSTSIHTDGEEQRFHAKKILPYSQQQLYSLVSDVPSYSSFIPFCNSSTVLTRPVTGQPSESSASSTSGSSSTTAGTPPKGTREWADWKPGTEPFDVLAELGVGFGGLEERYVSKVQGRPFESVTATASKSTPLFKSLLTRWSFSPASTSSPHPSSTPPSTTQSPSSTANPQPSPSPSSTSPTSNDGPTLLTIDLAFNFVSPLHRIASQAVLPKVADKMVEAFERRCLEVYGPGKR
ncbi:hypothetical protein IAU60_005147 [Kwoniella sp. DSM 27419]